MFRVGFGYDVHRLVENRDLIIGGVKIPHDRGLLGHSDADVLLHAIMDAMLGAVAAGDIGKHFPDTDEKWRGADSGRLLARVREIAAEQGYRINNVDGTIVAQRPKMAPYIGAMQEKIASILEVEVGRVNIKATTTEGLGFTGTEQGIAAYAVVTVVKSMV